MVCVSGMVEISEEVEGGDQEVEGAEKGYKEREGEEGEGEEEEECEEGRRDERDGMAEIRGGSYSVKYFFMPFIKLSHIGPNGSSNSKRSSYRIY